MVPGRSGGSREAGEPGPGPQYVVGGSQDSQETRGWVPLPSGRWAQVDLPISPRQGREPHSEVGSLGPGSR